jgi:hypothetical protein
MMKILWGYAVYPKGDNDKRMQVDTRTVYARTAMAALATGALSYGLYRQAPTKSIALQGIVLTMSAAGTVYRVAMRGANYALEERAVKLAKKGLET